MVGAGGTPVGEHQRQVRPTPGDDQSGDAPAGPEIDHRGGDLDQCGDEGFAVRDDVGDRQPPEHPQALRVGQSGEQRAVVGHALAVRPG